MDETNQASSLSSRTRAPERVTADTVRSARPPREKFFQFGHLRLAAVTLDEAIDRITGMALAEQPSVVVTSNIFHLMLAEEDDRFRQVARTCELNVADGWPLVAASRLMGQRVPERIAGVDLVDGLLRSSTPFRVAIMGGAPGIAELLANRFRRNHEVVFVDPLEIGVWEDTEYRLDMRARLEKAEPNLILIGIGAPKQELLSNELRDVVKGPIIGCGQTIDVLGGARARAPRPVQALGLEWAFRAMMEPRRLGRRYAHASWCYLSVLGRELRRRRAGRADGA